MATSAAAVERVVLVVNKRVGEGGAEGGWPSPTEEQTTAREYVDGVVVVASVAKSSTSAVSSSSYVRDENRLPFYGLSHPPFLAGSVPLTDPIHDGAGYPLMAYRKGKVMRIGDSKVQYTTGDPTKWYEEKTRHFPPDFTRRTLALFPTAVEQDPGSLVERQTKVIEWDGISYTAVEWNEKLEGWIEAYPLLTDKLGSNRHEKDSDRTRGCSDPKILGDCWANSKPPEQWVPSRFSRTSAPWSKLLGLFRLDMYGNVIASRLDASSKRNPHSANESLTFFDADHIFPFARGGRTKQDNLAAVQCIANRNIKNENMLQFLNPIEMQAGLNATQLVAMVDFVVATWGGKGKTKTMKQRLDLIKQWITASPANGDTFGNFQDEVERTTDGERLVRYFVERQRRALGDMVGGGAARGEREGAQHTEGEYDFQSTKASSSGATKATQPATEFQAYKLTVRRVRSTGTIELVGTAKKEMISLGIKDDPQFKALRMSYAGKPSYAWCKLCATEEQKLALIDELKGLASKFGCACVTEDCE